MLTLTENTKPQFHRRLNIPHKWTLSEPVSRNENNDNPETTTQQILNSQTPTKPAPTELTTCDTVIILASIFSRELLSNLCLFLLRSRLGGSLFIAGPMVTFYIGIVFRRPLSNPFVLALACFSAGDWKKANVVGFPGLNERPAKTCHLAAFLLFLLTAQLGGAALAAVIKAGYGKAIGSEVIDGAAWGLGQMHLRANINSNSSCWNHTQFPAGGSGTENIPIRLYGSSTKTMLIQSCHRLIRGGWWFAEDMCAALFLIVGFVHIWKWLRWDDTIESNPQECEQRYWAKIFAFSASSALLSLMSVLAFPTAHTGWHTTLYLSVYQTLRPELNLTVLNMDEPYLRAAGGLVGCLLALAYEQMIARISRGEKSGLDVKLFMILYHNKAILDPSKYPSKQNTNI